MNLSTNLSSAFVILFATLGPIETAVLFASLAAGTPASERRHIAMRAIGVAGTVLIVFALGGGLMLAALHVSLSAFRIAGGVLLFLQALTLTFASPGLSSITPNERREAEAAADIAVFPLAFPLIAGPGSLSAVVLLMGRSPSWIESAGVLAVLLVLLAITLAALLLSDRISRTLGKTGTDVIGRLSGLLLAALAVQFVIDGLKETGLFAPA